MCRKKLKAKKRHFQLLEIMVALLLIVGCAVPVMHIYYNMFKKQDSMARAYEIDHTAHLLHGKIAERLYKNEYSFDELNGCELVFVDQEIGEDLGRLGYACTFTLQTSEPKKDSKDSGKAKRLCDLIIKMKDQRNGEEKIYDYKLYIEGGPRPKKWDDDKNKTDPAKNGNKPTDDTKKDHPVMQQRTQVTQS